MRISSVSPLRTNGLLRCLPRIALCDVGRFCPFIPEHFWGIKTSRRVRLGCLNRFILADYKPFVKCYRLWSLVLFWGVFIPDTQYPLQLRVLGREGHHDNALALLLRSPELVHLTGLHKLLGYKRVHTEACAQPLAAAI